MLSSIWGQTNRCLENPSFPTESLWPVAADKLCFQLQIFSFALVKSLPFLIKKMPSFYDCHKVLSSSSQGLSLLTHASAFLTTSLETGKWRRSAPMWHCHCFLPPSVVPAGPPFCSLHSSHSFTLVHLSTGVHYYYLKDGHVQISWTVIVCLQTIQMKLLWFDKEEIALTHPWKGNFRFNLPCKHEFSQYLLEILISESSTILDRQVKYGHNFWRNHYR